MHFLDCVCGYMCAVFHVHVFVSYVVCVMWVDVCIHVHVVWELMYVHVYVGCEHMR